ncbi:MAG TPA: hypothetical protein VEK33_25170 [Terriglobales bacterium]|nr:hypothetical protein [Terriglobales bacterium]
MHIISCLFVGILPYINAQDIGLLLTFFGIRLMRAGLSFNEAISAVPVSLDRSVLLYAAAISMASTVLSSLAPALKASRTAIHADLQSESRGATPGRSHERLRAGLVGGEIALALFLLIGSGLLICGVYRLDHQKLGFDHDRLLTAGLVLDKARYPDSTKQDPFVRSLVGRLDQIPRSAWCRRGVRSTCLGTGKRSDPHQRKT